MTGTIPQTVPELGPAATSPATTWRVNFASPGEIRRRLLESGYLADEISADAVFLATSLDKPLLVEGPAGVGKTELAKSVALATGTSLIRLQCYEGLDETKALYEWDYRKQLLWLQAVSSVSGDRPKTDTAAAWHDTSVALFSREFLLARPLLQAILADEPVVLLIDEVDRMEVEAEALLLEILSDFQVTVPEIGTLKARTQPLVFLTCNGTREMSGALRRRCLFLPIGYPGVERETEILRLRVPELDSSLASQVARVVHAVRRLDLRKAPSLSETIDWARTLHLFGVRELDGQALARTLAVLLKHETDIATARGALNLDGLDGR